MNKTHAVLLVSLSSIIILVACAPSSVDIAHAIAQTQTMESIIMTSEAPTITLTPEATNTPIATFTPWPTSTPQPTSAPSIGSARNPYPYGEIENFTYTAADGSKAEDSIQVLKVIRGPEAGMDVLRANMFNKKAPDGMEYVLIELKVTLISGHVQLSDTDFYVASDGQIFGGTFSIGVCCLDSVGFPTLDVNLFQPTSSTGWIAQTVFIDDSNPLLALKSSGYNANPDADFFFAIK